MKVGVVPGLVAEGGVQAQSFIETPERIFYVPGKAIKRRQSVDNEVRLGRLLYQFIHVLAGSHIISHIHERDGIIEMLFNGFELLRRRTVQVLIADAEMDRGAIAQLDRKSVV